MSRSAPTARNMSLFLIISLVIVAFYNNPFNIILNIRYQTALAIPNLQTNNTNISSLASNDTSSITVVPTVNHPPVANAGINQTVNENTTVTLNGIASDPDPNNMLSYSWLQVAGPEVTLSNNNTTNPSFTSPSISSDTILKFLLTAKDDKGASSSPAVVTITIKPINQSPAANAGPDQTVNPVHVISLDGTKSNDPDDDPITYSWVQIEGPTVILNGADSSMATFTAPSITNISSDTELIFKLTVADSKNATNTDDVKVTIKYIPPPNQVPLANSGIDQSVSSGNTVTLDGSGSTDPDGSIIGYSWVQTSDGPVTLNGADTSTASFTTPDVSSDTQFKFSLTVKDDKGDTSSPAFVTITVKAASPTPPPSNMSTTEGTSPSSKEQYSFIRAWGSEGSGDGQFSMPNGIAINSSYNVYVADYFNHRIQKFTADGTFITAWGSEGTENGQFDYAQAIAVDSFSGNVYVSDSYNDRIQVFAPTK